jgi:hypothetical protein
MNTLFYVLIYDLSWGLRLVAFSPDYSNVQPIL